MLKALVQGLRTHRSPHFFEPRPGTPFTAVSGTAAAGKAEIAGLKKNRGYGARVGLALKELSDVKTKVAKVHNPVEKLMTAMRAPQTTQTTHPYFSLIVTLRLS